MASAPKTDFPPIRACLFDMDGLLIDSEDLLTLCHNLVLASYSSPPMTWTIKSQLQGRPASIAISLLLAWANLSHIPVSEYRSRLDAEHIKHFPDAKPLPGVVSLLNNLKSTEEAKNKKEKIHMALATSSHIDKYVLKTSHLSPLFSVFSPARKILGDDPRIPEGRGKPSPDIYQLALKAINESLEGGEEEVQPEECLVFEDSVPGVEAGRRAGMRVLWCPNEGLAELYRGREELVLAGRGEGSDKDVLELGVVGDGWGEHLVSLEDFDYGRYGIKIVE